MEKLNAMKNSALILALLVQSVLSVAAADRTSALLPEGIKGRILLRMPASKTPDRIELIAYYPFNEGSYKDESGNKNHGSPNFAPTEEEIMRYTEPAACESHGGSLEPRYLAPQ